MALDIDHLFLFIPPDGPEIEALRRLGLRETYRRAHPGQGTANACFAFDNLFLELIWLTSEAEARSPAIARTRLWERSQWRDNRACPLGIAVRGDLAGAGVTTWAYRPPYLNQILPPGSGIAVATDSDDPAQPMAFASPGTQPPADWPEAQRGALQREAGFGAVIAMELGLPTRPAAAPLAKALEHALSSVNPPTQVVARADGQHSLRLALADTQGRHTHTLEFAATPLGRWRASLIEERLPERS